MPLLGGLCFCRLVDVVLEAEAELQVGAVELAREGRVVGAFDGSPGGAVEGDVAGAAGELHGVGLQAAVGQDGEDDFALAALEDGRIHFLGDERIPGAVGFANDFLQVGAKVDALCVAQNLRATICAGMLGERAAAHPAGFTVSGVAHGLAKLVCWILGAEREVRARGNGRWTWGFQR